MKISLGKSVKHESISREGMIHADSTSNEIRIHRRRRFRYISDRENIVVLAIRLTNRGPLGSRAKRQRCNSYCYNITIAPLGNDRRTRVATSLIRASVT